MSRWCLSVVVLISMAVFVAGPGVVEAGKGNKPKKGKSAEQRFSKADANGDGKLSLEEFIGKRTDEKKARAEKRFKKLDQNNDSALSLEEYKAGQKKS